MAKIGRPKGSKNKKTVGMVIAQREGISPLEFLLSVMDDEDNDLNVRMDAAKSASPYCHARLSSVDFQGEIEQTITQITRKIVKPKPSSS